MDFEFEIPIAPEEIDEQGLESRGKMPSGYYRAECTDCFPDDKDHTGVKVVYKITAGPFASREITDTVWDPNNSDSDEKRKSALQRMLLVFKRLGCRDENSNKVNLRAAVGRQVVLHLVKQKEAWCQTCETTKVKGDKSRKCPTCGGAYKWVDIEDSFCNVEFDGVYPFDHPKIPAEVREALQLGPARPDDHEQSAAVTPAPAAATAAASRTKPAARPASRPVTTTPAAPPAPVSREARMAAALQDL